MGKTAQIAVKWVHDRDREAFSETLPDSEKDR